MKQLGTLICPDTLCLSDPPAVVSLWCMGCIPDHVCWCITYDYSSPFYWGGSSRRDWEDAFCSPVHVCHIVDKLRCPQGQWLLPNTFFSYWLTPILSTSSSFLHKQSTINYGGIWLLIVKWLLSMLCIKEIHLCVQFRLAFWQEFAQPQPVSFKKL